MNSDAIHVRGSAGARFGALLRTRTVGDFVLRESHYAPRLRTPAHYHGHAYLTFLARGGMRERDRRGDWWYGARSLHFHPIGEPHRGEIGPHGARCVSIVAAPALSARLDRLDPGAAAGPLDPAFARLAARCEAEFRAEDPASDLALEASLLELVAALLRSRPDRFGPRVPAWLLEARDCLEARYRERVSLAELATLCGRHPVHVVRAFRHHLCCTPGTYLRRLRVEHARRLLAETHEPIASLALDLGFSSQSHFTRVFSRFP